MKEYLQAHLGKKIGVIRIGIPKEVYFEAELKEIKEGVAVFEDEKGEEFALGIDKIILVGAPERKPGEEKPRTGFSINLEDKK